jgi:hypothetical protein
VFRGPKSSAEESLRYTSSHRTDGSRPAGSRSPARAAEVLRVCVSASLEQGELVSPPRSTSFDADTVRLARRITCCLEASARDATRGELYTSEI